ncbi:MAG TPA: hypothetical protein VKN18_05115 [Blastocatellia bacterium]|nr:hypothetical protein [Blastocatellia bacterium]
MAAVRFCTKCGLRPLSDTGSLTSSGLYCARCSPHSRRVRLTFIVITLLCAGIGFAAGRYTTTREPFYIIGTPIQIDDKGSPSGKVKSTPSTDENAPQVQPGADSAMNTTICGARTKSGKACQRKVKGGGLCWQHRAKG